MAWYLCDISNSYDGVKNFIKGKYYDLDGTPTAAYFTAVTASTVRDDDNQLSGQTDLDGTMHIATPLSTQAQTISSLTLASGASVTAILDEDAMTSDSATALATQQSIKAFAGAMKDYAGLLVDNNATATTINLVDNFHKITVFDTIQAESISSASHATDAITIGATSDYDVKFYASGASAGTNKTYEVYVYQIAAGTSVITGITQATPAVVTAVAHGFSNGDTVKLSGVVGMTEVNDRLFTVANKADDTFELTDDEGVDIASGGFTAYSSDGVAQLATSTGSHSHRKFAVVSDVGSLSGGVLVALTATNTIELYVKGTTDATNLTFEAISLIIERVG